MGSKHVEGLVYAACIIIGLGIGMIFGKTAEGAIIGVGVGLLEVPDSGEHYGIGVPEFHAGGGQVSLEPNPLEAEPYAQQAFNAVVQHGSPQNSFRG